MNYRLNPVTCKASEVLLHGTGYCYAKSHLQAALLRANSIPTGLCYQRLNVETEGSRYCLHGLNSVYLRQYGWYRVDARGNKPGVVAEFCPPVEKLAFSIQLTIPRSLLRGNHVPSPLEGEGKGEEVHSLTPEKAISPKSGRNRYHL